MSSKLLCAVLLLTSSCMAEHSWFPFYEKEAPEPSDDDMECDTPICVGPCPDVAPPRYCPANMTKCASGCVCMLECRSPTYVCFQTKFCSARRRYLKRTTKQPHYYTTIAEDAEG